MDDDGPDTHPAYAALCGRLREVALVAGCGHVLSWDEQTHLPRLATEHRGEQLALLSGLAHERATDPRLGELLGDLDGAFDADSAEAAQVREAARDYRRRTALPRRLVEEQSRVATVAQQAWVSARAADDFAAFLPHLTAVVELKREEADAVRAADPDLAGRPRYDALLDDHEPGADGASVAATFAALRAELAPLAAAIADSGVSPDTAPVRGRCRVEDQRRFVKAAAGGIGFDFDAGRLDTAAHPFCTGLGPRDVRLTTRYDERFFPQALFGTLHEAGHGIYEQRLPVEQHGTPLGEACSLGVHESQSRLWENFVGRGRDYWHHLLPAARAAFPSALGRTDVDAVYRAVNDVRPSAIRVEADEVTYNLHVMLRFELEQPLIAGSLEPADLPAAWDDAFEASLGFRPATPSDGVLQDIHWAAGLIGYFPTYTLGNLYAAMLWEAAGEALGDLGEQLRRGEFFPLRDWLTGNVHRHGRRYPAGELMERATGRTLTHEPLMRHLRGKFGALYGV